MNIDWEKFTQPEIYPDYQTEEICLVACHMKSKAIKFVAEQTEEIAWAALNHSYHAIFYIKEPTIEMWKMIDKKYDFAKVTKLMRNNNHPHLKTNSYNLFLVYLNPNKISNIEEHTLEICKMAFDGVNNSVWSDISLVSKMKIMPRELWTYILSISPGCFSYINVDFKTEEMYNYVFENYVINGKLSLDKFLENSSIQLSPELIKKVNKIKLFGEDNA